MRKRRRTALARSLRRTATSPEREAWKWLRARRMLGLKFRRQHPLGPFVADFYCAEWRLVVEIDGRTHEARTDYDAARDAHFAAGGYHVIRIEARGLTQTRLRDAIAAALDAACRAGGTEGWDRETG